MSQAIINPKIIDYMSMLAKKDDTDILLEMEAHAKLLNFPIVERLVGRMLFNWTAAIGAKRIFELGSGFGYSAYWFSQAVGENGKVICTDGGEHNLPKAKDYLSRAHLWDRVEYHVGIAQEILNTMGGQFDIIYNDVDKDQYPGVFKMAVDRIRPGGLYIADNALWFGRVVEDIVTDDIREGCTEAIKEHNQMVFSHPNFDTTLIPLRDGVIVARKRV